MKDRWTGLLVLVLTALSCGKVDAKKATSGPDLEDPLLYVTLTEEGGVWIGEDQIAQFSEREFERSDITRMSSVVQPRIHHYLKELDREVSTIVLSVEPGALVGWYEGVQYALHGFTQLGWPHTVDLFVLEFDGERVAAPRFPTQHSTPPEGMGIVLRFDENEELTIASRGAGFGREKVVVSGAVDVSIEAPMQWTIGRARAVAKASFGDLAEIRVPRHMVLKEVVESDAE